MSSYSETAPQPATSSLSVALSTSLAPARATGFAVDAFSSTSSAASLSTLPVMSYWGCLIRLVTRITSAGERRPLMFRVRSSTYDGLLRPMQCLHRQGEGGGGTRVRWVLPQLWNVCCNVCLHATTPRRMFGYYGPPQGCPSQTACHGTPGPRRGATSRSHQLIHFCSSMILAPTVEHSRSSEHQARRDERAAATVPLFPCVKPAGAERRQSGGLHRGAKGSEAGCARREWLNDARTQWVCLQASRIPCTGEQPSAHVAAM